MTKPTKYLCALALLALAGWVCFWQWSSQPVYAHQPMRWWLRQTPSPWDFKTLAVQREALRTFGPRAIPDLLSTLEGGPSWQHRMRHGDDWVYRESNQRIRLLGWGAPPDVPLQFSLLGELADPAVPELLKMATSANDDLASEAARCLVNIGTSNALAALGTLLTSTNLRQQYYGANLASFGARARPFTPTLLRLAQSSDAWTSYRATRTVLLLEDDFPALFPSLSNTLFRLNHPHLQNLSQTLRRFGSGAAVVAPGISNLLQTPQLNEAVQRQLETTLVRLQCEVRDGAVVRGPRDRRRLALLFTGHEFAEGAEVIIAALGRHEARASFFLTGGFLTNAAHAGLAQRFRAAGHYVGIHSDAHLLYCSWDRPPRTLVSNWQFEADVRLNQMKLNHALSLPDQGLPSYLGTSFFVPPYEHWNPELALWAHLLDYEFVGYTPGTRSNADYTEESASNFVPSQAIFDSILARERTDPHGLNGFLLLLHLGAGPGRKDKFHPRLDELLTALADRGYEFVRVDELLDGRVPQR